MFKLLLLFLICFFIYLYFVSRPFKNPYKLIFIFGRKGSGKSTYLTKLSVKFNKLGWHVFSDSPIFGTYKLNNNWIGVYDFPPNSVLLIDEGAIVFHQRNWKQFKESMKNFFVMQRHKRVYCVVASQSFNVDKVVRDLTDELYLLVNYFNVFTIAKRIHRGVKLANTESDSEGFIADAYSWDLPWNWQFVWIPRWINFFSSFRQDPLPKVHRSKWKFNDEPYLYKLTYYRFYKVEQIKDLFHKMVDTINRRFYTERFTINLTDLLQFPREI